MTDILNTPVAFCRAEDRYLRATSLHRPLNSHNNSFRQALRSPSATSLGEGSSPNGSAQVLHELRRIKLSKPIQSLATSCLDVLEWLSLSITGGQRNSVQRQFHMLRLWCDGLDIANGSLDVRLKEDSRALASSIKFLLDLGLLLVASPTILAMKNDSFRCDRLEEFIWQAKKYLKYLKEDNRDVKPEEEDDEDSDSSDDEREELDIDISKDEFDEEFASRIECLIELGPLIQRASSKVPAAPYRFSSFSPMPTARPKANPVIDFGIPGPAAYWPAAAATEHLHMGYLGPASQHGAWERPVRSQSDLRRCDSGPGRGEDQKVPMTRDGKRTRIPHTAVERRYRENINAHLQKLRQSVPSLAKRGESNRNDGAEGVKPSKCEILSGAIEHITALETTNVTLMEEVKRLRATISAMGNTGNSTESDKSRGW